MIKKLLFLFLICLCFINMQCEDSDDVVDLDCDFTVIIDKEKYDNLHTESFKLSNAEIAGNCLTVTVSASGCDGNTWEYQLVDIH